MKDKPLWFQKMMKEFSDCVTSDGWLSRHLSVDEISDILEEHEHCKSCKYNGDDSMCRECALSGHVCYERADL